jgi:hypothetical protein
MSLQTTSVDSATARVEEAIALGWNPVCYLTYNRDAWVQLLEPPSLYAADEAMLLCQASFNSWVAWVPNHGEVLLNRSQFY